MPSSAVEQELDVAATSVVVTDETITVELEDGRSISVPTAWYPRLLHATPAERANYEILSSGILWDEVDGDVSIRGLLLGRKSGESPESFKFWLDNRRKGKRVTLADYVQHRRRSRSKAAKSNGRRAGAARR